jgi:hypothetical protein
MGTRANDSDSHVRKWITQARNRLAARREEKPLTKAGQIRAVWPQVEAALANGQSLSSIRNWLEDEGVVVSLRTLSSYKTRFRRREDANRKRRALEASIRQTGLPQERVEEPLREPPHSPADSNAQPSNEHDPYAQARRVLNEKRPDIRNIHGDGDPTGRDLV